MKIALKSKINTSCESSYHFGDPLYFKLDSAQKWKSGTCLCMDKKVLFIRYGNFIRRVPIGRVVPAEVYEETPEVEADPDDKENSEKSQDGEFENVEIIAKKDKKIELLKEINSKQEQKIAELSAKPEKTKHDKVNSSQSASEKSFPGGWKELVLDGEVIYKHKPKSVHKNIIVILV